MPPSLFDDRCPIEFYDDFLRSLEDQNPSIHFYDRWPIVSNYPVLTIVAKSVLAIQSLRSWSADWNPTILFYDRSLADRF